MDGVINIWAVLACAIFSMILGSIWFGPLFGKKWMEITGADPSDLAKRKEMQKNAGPLYAVQFVLSLFQAWVLAYYIAGWPDISGVTNSLWIWAGFVMPIVAGGSMWNNDSSKVAWSRFWINASYQLVLFISYGLILGFWR